MSDTKPTQKEELALNLFYNRFYDLYEEIVNEDFFSKSAMERFNKLRDSFAVYKELLGYEPINHYIKYIKQGGRPPLEGIIADDLFSFIRNLLMHYPIFDKWDDVYITKDLATWNKKGTIHKFLSKCTKIKIDGKGSIKYRIWSEKRQQMTYLEVNFPEVYEDNKIYLRDILSEKEGVVFCLALMKQILDTQVYTEQDPDIKIMSQVYIPKINSSENRKDS